MKRALANPSVELSIPMDLSAIHQIVERIADTNKAAGIANFTDALLLSQHEPLQYKSFCEHMSISQPRYLAPPQPKPASGDSDSGNEQDR